MGDVSLNPQPLINDEPLTLPATAAKHGGQVGGLISSGWTNERHSSYISSMEASFVDQLYGHPNRGFDVHNRHLGNNEFKVIQESVCKNIKFEKNHPRNLDTRTNGLPENPWVRRFRPRSAGLNGHGICIEAIADDYGSGTEMAQEKVRTHGREVKACTGQNLIGKSKEVSDQNFPDEVEAGNEPCKKQRPTSSSAAPNDMGT